jgi:hypothetical protein
MQKIISLFQRNYETDRLVRNEVVPGAVWVLKGEGHATRKWDGTCCMVRDGKLYKRYDAKAGKTPPPGFEAAQDPDPNTGHWPGWLLVGDGPDDRWHREAFDQWKHVVSEDRTQEGIPDGTYELCGPKIQGNPEGLPKHCLVTHGGQPLDIPSEGKRVPRNFEGIKEYLRVSNIEGIVWHHEDGRMVKIKRKDFFKKEKRSPK